jgi:hypothetical protein
MHFEEIGERLRQRPHVLEVHAAVAAEDERVDANKNSRRLFSFLPPTRAIQWFWHPRFPVMDYIREDFESPVIVTAMTSREGETAKDMVIFSASRSVNLRYVRWRGCLMQIPYRWYSRCAETRELRNQGGERMGDRQLGHLESRVSMYQVCGAG